MKMVIRPQTLNYWRAMTDHCSSFGEKVRKIREGGVSAGRAILLARKISTPEQWNHWMRHERVFEYEQKLRRQARYGNGFRFT
jgi:hypothetical protein